MRAGPASLRAILTVLLGAALALPLAPAFAQSRVGINAAVNTDANGTPPNAPTRKLVIGQEVVHNERIVTDARGQTQILFLDGSSVSVGPNADLVIDEFIYDPATGTGKMTLTAVQGAMRFVGGKLSKQENAVTLHIGTATIGVRGGVFIADIQPGGKTEVVFLYGKAVTVSGQSGCSEALYRPGFAVDINASGGCPDNPHQAPPGTTVAIMAQLDGRAGASGGATTIPTDATVAASGVGTTISGAVTTSIAAAAQSAPPAASPPTPTVNPPQVPQSQTQIASSQTQPIVSTPTTTPSPPPPPPPTPPVTGVSGGYYTTTTPATGFTGIATTFSNGTFANGVLTSSTPPTSITVNGSTYVAPDGSFFDGAFTQDGATGFVYGGVPVTQTFNTGTSQTRFFAFNVQRDAALGSPIPFITNQTGGSIPNPTVSPFYLTSPANLPFGGPQSGGVLGKGLQASLAISGTGAAQTSVIVVTVGNPIDDSPTPGTGLPQPVFFGATTGSYLPAGMLQPTSISGGVANPPDPTGTGFYGGNAISGFALASSFNSATTLPTTANGSPQFTNYGFVQGAVPASPSATNGLAAAQTGGLLTGYAGGIMVEAPSATNPAPLGYPVIGPAAISLDAPDLRIAATLGLTDPLTQQASGLTSAVLQYGNIGEGTGAEQGYISDNVFGTLESPSATSTVNGSSAFGPLYLLSSGTVPSNAVLPNGQLCACQFLQWGYWGGQLTTDSGTPRTDTANINFWAAGLQTNLTSAADIHTLAMGSATANYTGNLIGSVVNNGAQYIATGGLNASYNFGTQVGTFAVSNYDGLSFTASGPGPLTGSSYVGVINSGIIKGAIAGSFYGPMAAETGGAFAFTAGPTYTTSGIFGAVKH